MREQDPEKLGFKRVASLAPDERGRVTLTKLFQRGSGGVSFAAYVNDAGQIMLDPVVEIPAREQWLYRNPKAMKALKAGLESGAEKPPKSLGSFAKYARDRDD
jgi:hypothetical protein